MYTIPSFQEDKKKKKIAENFNFEKDNCKEKLHKRNIKNIRVSALMCFEGFLCFSWLTR